MENIEALVSGHEVGPNRLKSLELAAELGADAATLAIIRDAIRVGYGPTVVVPASRLEGLSRGRGWARQGRGDKVVWAERVDGGYRVGVGRWVVGGSDGFARKDSVTWDVAAVQVGGQTWTVAS